MMDGRNREKNEVMQGGKEIGDVGEKLQVLNPACSDTAVTPNRLKDPEKESLRLLPRVVETDRKEVRNETAISSTLPKLT
ncbi:hypothetical protein PAMP_013408 [Pampus punctatissimus]